MSGASYRILLVTEGPNDVPRATSLFYHRLRQRADWVTDPPRYATFVGLQDGESYLKMSRITATHRNYYGPRVGYTGRLGSGDARMFRRLGQILKKLHTFTATIDVVIWLRDTDSTDRGQRVLQERATQPLPVPTAIGYANQCTEAWVIIGFEPKSASERKALKTHQGRLGRDPRTNAHRLSHKDVPGGAKQVQRSLLGDSDEESCLALAIERAAPSNDETGLVAFIAELDASITVVIAPRG